MVIIKNSRKKKKKIYSFIIFSLLLSLFSPLLPPSSPARSSTKTLLSFIFLCLNLSTTWQHQQPKNISQRFAPAFQFIHNSFLYVRNNLSAFYCDDVTLHTHRAAAGAELELKLKHRRCVCTEQQSFAFNTSSASIAILNSRAI